MTKEVRGLFSYRRKKKSARYGCSRFPIFKSNFCKYLIFGGYFDFFGVRSAGSLAPPGLAGGRGVAGGDRLAFSLSFQIPRNQAGRGFMVVSLVLTVRKVEKHFDKVLTFTAEVINN